MNFEDQTLINLKRSIENLKMERDIMLKESGEQRSNHNQMEIEMNKMKREQQYLQQLIREKEAALSDYDRMIGESEITLQKLIENSQKLLLTLDGEAGKLKAKQ